MTEAEDTLQIVGVLSQRLSARRQSLLLLQESPTG